MNEPKFDVVALGELLIDFTQNGVSGQGNPLFEANPGGAPANVLAMLCKLGRRCAFLGKVGADGFGDQLAATLERTGIDLRGLRRDAEVHTTLAIVHTLPGGDRDFSFYRKPGADMMLRPEELDRATLSACRIFHFGSLSLTDEPCRSATREALAIARRAGALISFDPNLRPPLWADSAAARTQIEWGLSQCDVLKIADNELEFMTGEADLFRGADILRGRFPSIRLLNVTLGAEGSRAYCGGAYAAVPGCGLGGVIETTGAGDAFCACVLDYVLSHGPDGLTVDQLREMLRFANAAAYLVTTRRGAIRSMPDPAEVAAVLAAWPDSAG
jgi:fructokinase